jgi:hypothetical protein
VFKPRGRQAAFTGRLTNLSSTGLGLETAEELPTGPVRLRLHLPGIEEPMDSTVRLVWQKAHGTSSSYRSGCAFVRLPAGIRSRLMTFVAQQRA